MEFRLIISSIPHGQMQSITTAYAHCVSEYKTYPDEAAAVNLIWLEWVTRSVCGDIRIWGRNSPAAVRRPISACDHNKGLKFGEPPSFLASIAKIRNMTIEEGVADLSNGGHLTYIDTGIPEGVSDYRTFIFIHGAAHNKFTWEPLLKVIPKGFRGLAFSQRGFEGSMTLTPEEIACTIPPSQLCRTHVSDLASFIEFVGEKLNVPQRSSDGTGGITLVPWSKGCASITGLFYFQKENPSYKDLLDKYISSVVLYEPPTSAVFGINPGDCANALFYSRLAAPPEDPGFMFAKYVTGFYRHDPEYLSQKGGKQVTQYYRAGALEPEFQKYSAKVFEGKYMPAILHWFLHDDEGERYEACHEAFREMAKSSLKRIGIIWGSEGPPECLERSWIGEKWLKEEEAKTGVKKVVTQQFEGGNHYIQFYDVQGFWKSILDLSV